MYLVLGATGHIGKAVVTELLQMGQPVTAITHDEHKAKALEADGVRAAVVDVHDVERLRAVFRTGERLFLLNPPASPASDTDAEELGTMRAIVAALDGSGLTKVVAQSTYGAQAGERLGDLSVLFEMEQELARQPIPVANVRAAYLMSNWASAVKSAREESTVMTFFPADFALPMVDPADVAAFAAERLAEPPDKVGTFHVEGPRRYTPDDVAQALGKLMKKDLRVKTAERSDWFETYKRLGFSDASARSYERMTAVTLGGKFPSVENVWRGPTTLDDSVASLMESAG